VIRLDDSNPRVNVRLLRYLWAAPGSFLGLVIASFACRRGRASVVDGVLEVHGPWLAWALCTCTPWCGGAVAMTFGHVVLARDQATLDSTRVHERVHIRQYERWGPAFIPAYPAASAWARLRGRHPYYDNPFEREAFAAE